MVIAALVAGCGDGSDDPSGPEVSIDIAITTAHFDTVDCSDYVVDWPTE
jgi:hypothetical protein